MTSDDLDFSADLTEDRAAVLLDAARRVDALSGHLGATGEADNEFGDLLRALNEDSVEFGSFPDVLPVPILDLPNADRTSAAWRAALEEGYTFWWIRLPILLFPRRGWGFTRLELRVDFNPDEPDPRRRPRAFDILPNRRFDTIVSAGGEFHVGVGADAKLAVKVPTIPLDAIGALAGVPLPLSAGGKAKAEVGASVDVALAPVRFRMTAARVDHTAEGLEKVFWRLDGAEFFAEDPPQLVIILQVPRDVESVRMRAVMRAYRRFTFFPAGLQAMIRELPSALRAFFTQGAPVGDTRSYDLSPVVRAS
ncbi:hypothetical protein HDA40_002597 [Hamadaea flava]|uniref:Uncharacterized protein n=1 Tax=Hamadaea flava TaxID=1742688 RepID=A0ABV8LMZ1_9ACTN|nr:hypothetical protein [Hamadaea flava]MCP2324090.1 hypothetical protein [Hamadaea flava]